MLCYFHRFIRADGSTSHSYREKFSQKMRDVENFQAESRKVGVPIEVSVSEVEVEPHLVSIVRPGTTFTSFTVDPHYLV